MKLGSYLVVAIGLCLAAASESQAQVRTAAWGLIGTLAPKWKVSDYEKQLYKVDEVDVSGREFTAGFVRGRTYKSYWGLSFQQRRINDASFTRRQGVSGPVTRSVSGPGTLRGVELTGFVPFSTIKEKAQIGLTWGFGGAEWKGTFQETVGNGAPVTLTNRGLLKIVGDQRFTPTVRLEITGTAILSPNVRAVVGGGLNLPGMNTLRLGIVYLFGGG